MQRFSAARPARCGKMMIKNEIRRPATESHRAPLDGIAGLDVDAVRWGGLAWGDTVRQRELGGHELHHLAHRTLVNERLRLCRRGAEAVLSSGFAQS